MDCRYAEQAEEVLDRYVAFTVLLTRLGSRQALAVARERSATGKKLRTQV